VRRFAVVFLLLVLVPGAAGAPARRSGATIVEFAFASHALKRQLHFTAILPAGYTEDGLSYPVVYFLHGLPAGPNAYKDVGWLRDALGALSPGVILVAPQGSTKEDADPEYLDWGPGHNWETAISQELPHYVDAHLHTIAARNGRALVGLSAGGYGAVILALHHLDDFAVVESWSGYFHPTDVTGKVPLDLGTTAKNTEASAHAFITELQKDEQVRPTFFAFYVGAKDTRFRAENVQLDRELTRAHVAHVFEIYPGAHERTVWAAHAAAWLQLAAQHLTQAR
jgi:putative tributyrin esterase